MSTDVATGHRMHLLIVTCGTEGDARPLAALGHALASAGHGVHLLADAATLDTARALGLRATALAGDIRGTLSRRHGMRDIERNLLRLVWQHSPQWLRQALDAGRGCDAVIVSGLTAFVGLSAAEALGVPAIGAMLIPITPTADFPAPLLPLRPPRTFNAASHRLSNQLSWQLMRRTTNRARVQAGMAPRTRLWDGHPMLYGISPTLLPSPADWPGNAHLTGQWLPPSDAWTPPPELLAFLDDGAPPVYVGFGSMTGFDPRRIEQALGEGLGGRRTLFNPGWSGIDPTRLPPNVHAIGSIPHDWLLPRCALAVHHGGSGTSHSACRAGVPSVVVPFAGDQPFWGGRLHADGVAAAPLPARAITGARLAAAIAFAERQDVKARAASLGRRMRGEDGCARAVALVERYAAQS